MLSKGRRVGAYRQGRERDLDREIALRFMAEGRAAVVVPAPFDPGPPNGSSGRHVYLYRRAALSLEPELAGGRRRLRVFEPDSEWTFTDDEASLADELVALGCACRALPQPAKKDTLVCLSRDLEVAGTPMLAGQVAAVEFDPHSVLPELRGLGLFPWEVVTIESNDGLPVPRGPEMDRIRLVVHLDAPWLHPTAGSFLVGVHVDMSYGDYRLHPPVGRLERAYVASGRLRAPFGVFGPGVPRSPSAPQG